MTNKHYVFAGAALLAFGLFMPSVTMPMVGTLNLFNNGSLVGVLLLAIAAACVALTVKERTGQAIWPAIAAGLITAYSYARLQYLLHDMQRSLTELGDNPFAGMVQGAMGSIQIQWGWLVLVIGVGLIAYGAWRERGEHFRLFRFPDKTAKGIAVASAIAFVALPVMDLIGLLTGPADTATTSTPTIPTTGFPDEAVPTAAADAEELAYIRDHLELYDVSARYQDSMLDGRVPGVDFKVRNNGTRTLNRVTVRVVFRDASDQPIAEEEYSPVFVSSYSYGHSNTPLRPGYIWQQERGRFYTGTSVPSEWEAGNVVATITQIEFGPDE